MKKFIALLLALTLALALISCAKEKTPDAPVADTPVADTPSDKVPESDASENDPYAAMYTELGVTSVPNPEYTLAQYEKLQAGELYVTFCSLDFAQNIIQEFADGVVDFWLEKGQKADKFSADGDLTEQANQIENCVIMGADLIVVASSSIASLADACRAAMEQGVQVVIRGETSTAGWGFEPTALECQKNVEQAWYNADMIFAYIKQNFPDVTTAKFALAEFTIPTNLAEISKGLEMRIEAETELQAEITYRKDMVMTPEEGFTFAEEALTYDPDIRYFSSYTDAPVIGINNYIMQRPDANIAEFCATTNCGSAELSEIMNVFSEHGSIIPGYAGMNWHDNPKALRDCTWNCLMGLVDTNSGVYVEYSDIIIDCVFDYNFGDGGQMWPEA